MNPAHLLQDLRFALRSLRARGGAALFAMATLATGIVLALASTRAAQSALYGVPAGDPVTLGGVSLLLLGTLLLACLVPARRASAVAPREALN